MAIPLQKRETEIDTEKLNAGLDEFWSNETEGQADTSNNVSDDSDEVDAKP